MPVYFECICAIVGLRLSLHEVAGNSLCTRLILGRTDGHTLVFDSCIIYRQHLKKQSIDVYTYNQRQPMNVPHCDTSRLRSNQWRHITDPEQ